MNDGYLQTQLSFFIFSSYGAWAECFILWSVTEQCFIAKWNEAASSEKAFYEALCVLHASGVSSTQKYEAALRAMKRTFGAWSEAFSGFIHHFCKAKMVEVAVKTANFLPASKRSQILQNGSLLQFNGKRLRRMALRWSKRTAFRWIAIRPPQKEPCRTFEPCSGKSCRTSANRSPLLNDPRPSIITYRPPAHNGRCIKILLTRPSVLADIRAKIRRKMLPRAGHPYLWIGPH